MITCIFQIYIIVKKHLHTASPYAVDRLECGVCMQEHGKSDERTGEVDDFKTMGRAA